MIGQMTEPADRRRIGALGELDTISERLARMIEIWTVEEQPIWNRVVWWEEQIRRLAEHARDPRRSPLTIDALLRCIDALGNDLQKIGRCEAEVHGEGHGALRHVDGARHAVRIDQHLADQFRLQAAGLDDTTLATPLTQEVA